MSDPIRLDDLLAEVFDVTPVPVEIDEPDEIDDTDAIDDVDFAPEPQFSDFEVWCPDADDWAKQWRPSPESPWLCRYCELADHTPRDHEGAGA